MLDKGGCTAGDLSLLLGSLESLRLATTHAALHFRGLQYLQPLQGRQKDFPVKKWLNLSSSAKADLLWLTSEFPSVLHTCTLLVPRPVAMELWTDTLGLVGWGGQSSRGGQVQGRWTSSQNPWRINLKELEAARFRLEEMMLDRDLVNLFMYSRVAVAFVNRQRGTRSWILCSAALDLWKTVLSRARGGWIKAHWVPREENEQADYLSNSAL